MSPPRHWRGLAGRRPANDESGTYSLLGQTSARDLPEPARADVRSLAKELSRERTCASTKRETVLEMILELKSDDICWVFNCAIRSNPSLEPALENYRKTAAESFDLQAMTIVDQRPAQASMASPLKNGRVSPRARERVAYNPSTLPILQFMAPQFFVSEDQSSVRVEVLRSGNKNVHSEVFYSTVDGSGMDGKVYKGSSGKLVFQPGEMLKAVAIDLIDDSEWNPSRDFLIELSTEGLVNATLDKYLWHTKVTVVDDDPFPSRKYKDLIWDERLHEVPNVGLVREYIAMQWRNDKIRNATKKILFTDMLVNIYFLLKALLQMYLVDIVLNMKDSQDLFLIMGDRRQTLAWVAIFTVLPQVLLHQLALQHPFGMGSESRKLLQKSLFGRFLNYSPAVDIAEGDLLMAMSRDSLDIVDDIYKATFEVFALMGRVFMICITQFVAPLVFGHSIKWISIIPLVLFPFMMVVFLAVRDHVSTKVLFERLRLQDDFIEFIAEAVANQSFINECNARVDFLDICELKIDTYHAARKAAKRVVVNNKQFAEWLSTLVLAFYTVVGGWAVIDGYVTLGLYVTNINMFRGMGQVYSDIYSRLMTIQEVTPGLKRLTRLLNVPTDLNMRAQVSQYGHDIIDRFFADGASSDVPLIDQLPICVCDVVFRYESSSLTSDRNNFSTLSKIHKDQEGMNFHGELRMTQGNLVQLIGPHGEGKTTLLKLIGGVILPKLTDDVLQSMEISFFVPPHLHAIYLPSEAVFFRASLMDNLTLGVRANSPDARIERVISICERVGIPEALCGLLKKEYEGWRNSLSHTQLAHLSIARALISNPQLLCIERHWMGFNDDASMHILMLLREHVDLRGIEQDPNDNRGRRPRTILMTGTDADGPGMQLVDLTYSVSMEKGIKLVPARQAAVKQTLMK